MKIHKLTPTHPAVIGYPYTTSEDEIEFYSNLFDTNFYTGQSVLEHWKSTFLCDLHTVDIGRLLHANEEFWVLNEKARIALSPLMGHQVEFLPFLTRNKFQERFTNRQLLLRKDTIDATFQIIHPDQQYLINILEIRTTEILDKKQSEYHYDEEDDIIYGIEKLAFLPEKIENAHLFKIKNNGVYFRSATFVSDQFKTIVEENNLTGLTFSKLPIDEGGNLIWDSQS